ncbi:hypothetical protein D4A92_16145 [Rhizobium rosettiformans]|uniref:Secreted protein n=1 Tax=Rhizobium rosettiformans TaxID=1368430 RepID=A0ABX7EXV3_9HYPH|nr:hypothetical protein [Rhizobium rosettiformans]QRF52856.1 hypothetical protein D4A92_16145 [Rhizobium rosettiformans]
MYFTNMIPPLALASLAIAFATPVAANELLQIDQGRYVQSQHECSDPKGSMLFIYDGKSVKSGKTSCKLSNVTQSGNVYQFDESCSYYHRSWSILPTTVTEYKSRLEVLNKREFVLKRENENLEMTDHYRWCSAE